MYAVAVVTSEGRSIVQMVGKIGRILDLFSVEKPEWGVSKLGSEFRMPESTAHELAQSLAGQRFCAARQRTLPTRMACVRAPRGCDSLGPCDRHDRGCKGLVRPFRLRTMGSILVSITIAVVC